MDSVKFKTIIDKKGRISGLSIGGLLVIENSHYIQKELIGILNNLNSKVEITIDEVDDIDLSFVQLMVAFTRKLAVNKNKYQIFWSLEEEHRMLFENVGLSNELFINE